MQSTPHILPLIASAIVTTFVAIYSWKHREVNGASGMAILAAAVSAWSFFYALEFGAPTLPEKMIWSKLVYAGVLSIPPAWLIFTLQYSQRAKWLTTRKLVLLWLVPLATFVLVLTNDLHGLFWSQVWLAADLRVEHGALFWAWVAYGYACLAAGIAVMVWRYASSAGLFRRQTGVILLAGLVPWVINALYLAGLFPGLAFDPTPYGFTLSGLGIAWGLFRLRMLDILPVAHDAVFYSMSDGVLILDEQDRVIDMNPAAERIIRVKLEKVIGKPAGEVLREWSSVIRRYQGVQVTQAEVSLGEGDALHDFELRTSPLTGWREQYRGRLLMLRDITKRKRVEDAEREQRLVAETLRDTAAELSSTLDLDEVFDRILLNLGRVAPHNASNIMLIEGDTCRVVRCRGYAEMGTELLVMGLRFEYQHFDNLQTMAKTGQPVLISNTRESSGWKSVPESSWLLSYMGAPILIKGEVIGFIGMDSAVPGVFTPAHLERLRLFAEQSAIAIENARLYREMQELAVIDDVTGLYNRRKFFDLGQHEVEKAWSSDQPISAIIMDLDRFKSINDTYGHQVGDQALRAVASICRENLRNIDIVGRYGGDEFVILLLDCDAQTAGRIAGRLCQAIADTFLPTSRGSLHLTASLGVATAQGDQMTLQGLILNADQALMAAKQAGRNRVVASSK